jgi:peptidoglycan L-alanyl-D-glutamate endopeptidase CwlK
MPKFSQESFSKLSTCHPDLQAIFFEVVKSFDCTIIEGYRDQVAQEKFFDEGKTQLHWPNGKHNARPSLAVDVAPVPVDFTAIDAFYWFGGYVFGVAQKLKDEGKITHPLRWGGNWTGNKQVLRENFLDLVHYELIL